MRTSPDPTAGASGRTDLRVAVVSPFLNEAAHLPVFLESLAAQVRPPDEVILVDDGSSDGSGEMATAFAEAHPHVRALGRPRRERERDRLAAAAELKAFQWGAGQLSAQPDVLVKLDADLRLSPRFFEAIVAELTADPRLGIVGAYLSQPAARGGEEPDRDHPPYHTRGATKCYRWPCWAEIQPLDAVLGWDTADETKARLHGWTTRSIDIPGGDPLHLRPTGMHDGRLRAQRRWGRCAWGFGSHPLYVVAAGMFRMRRRPYVLGGLHYIAGFAMAAAERQSRVGADVRRQRRREERAELGRRLRRA